MAAILYKTISMKKKGMILEYKQCSNDLDTKTYLFLKSAKNILNYQNENSELMEISIIYSKVTISEKFKVFFKISFQWI